MRAILGTSQFTVNNIELVITITNEKLNTCEIELYEEGFKGSGNGLTLEGDVEQCYIEDIEETLKYRIDAHIDDGFHKTHIDIRATNRQCLEDIIDTENPYSLIPLLIHETYSNTEGFTRNTSFTWNEYDYIQVVFSHYEH